MNISKKLLRGIGVKGAERPSYDGKKMLREYEAWSGMLRRCTKECSDKYPTYMGTTCSDSFKYYPFFYDWCQTQVGFKNTDDNGYGWQLDKDLLFKGNKHYSEDTCVFVPQRINTLLIKCNNSRGDLPIGVSFDKEKLKFMAACSDGKGKTKKIGRYLSINAAFQAYKSFKEALIKEVANEYRTQLDPRAYEALMNYEVEVTD